MTIRADLSTLPRGNPPSSVPEYGALLAEAWAAEFVDETDRAFAVDGARLRASYAGGCARELGYKIAKTPETNPTGLSGYWVMGLGSMIHEHLQPLLEKAYPGASIEHVVDWQERIGLPGASHVDAYLVTSSQPIPNPGGAQATLAPQHRTVIEIKSVGGFKYKLMVGSRGPAQGPASTAILQAGLSARALDADEVVIVVLSREALSQREADKIGADEMGRFVAEWRYPMSALDEMIDQEIARLGRVLELVDANKLPPRHMPGEMPAGARVVDPASGSWTMERGGSVLEAGTLWKCPSYCGFRDRCLKDGPS